MNYKEQIQAQNDHKRIFKISYNSLLRSSRQIAAKLEAKWGDLIFYGRHTFLMALFSVEWMISIKLFKVAANIGNLSLFSWLQRFKVGQNPIHLAVFALQPTWRPKTVEGSMFSCLWVLKILQVYELKISFIFFVYKEKMSGLTTWIANDQWWVP